MSGGARSIAGVETSILALVDRFERGPLDRADRVLGPGVLEERFGPADPSSPGGLALRQFFRNGGREALIARVDDRRRGPNSAGPASPTERWGEALDRLEGDFQLLAIPGVYALGQRAEVEVVYRRALELCERRRAFLLIDPPAGVTASDLAGNALPATLQHANAALYFPTVHVDEPPGTQAPPNIGASGTVAGIMARTDTARGVWKAPAGREASLRGASPASEVDDAETALLAAAGVNALRTVSGAGPVVWGARTTAGSNAASSEWKYVPVRRFALFLEESVERGLQWAASEPNAEPLWIQVRQGVSAFLQDLYRNGAFAGQKPSDAWFVKCDAETMTQQDRERGILNVLIGFAPLKPAEFVMLKLALKAGVAGPAS